MEEGMLLCKRRVASVVVSSAREYVVNICKIGSALPECVE